MVMVIGPTHGERGGREGYVTLPHLEGNIRSVELLEEPKGRIAT